MIIIFVGIKFQQWDYTLLLLWKGYEKEKKEWKSWDLYMSSWSLDLGLLVFKANKLYLKWKTTLFIFECLWWRVAWLVGALRSHLPPSVGVVCAFSHSLAFMSFTSSALYQTLAWRIPLGFLELFLLVRQKDLSSHFTFIAGGSSIWFSSLRWSVPIYSLYLLEVLKYFPKTCIASFPATGSQSRLLWAFSRPSHRIHCSVISPELVINLPWCPIRNFRGVSRCFPAPLPPLSSCSPADIATRRSYYLLI